MLDTDATMELPDCSFSFHFLVSKDITKLGLMLQAINFTSLYEDFTSLYEILQVYMRNSYLLLTNQITVFVTTMI